MIPQPTKQTPISPRDRVQLKQAIIKAGKNPAGLSDIELIEMVANLETSTKATSEKATSEVIELPKKKEADDTPKEKAPTKKANSSKDPAQAIQALDQLKELILNGGGMDEARIIELIHEHGQGGALTIKIERDDSEPVQIDGAHKQMAEVLNLIKAGLKPFLCGGAGSGKTTIAQHVATALGLDFYFTGSVFQKYELLGFIDAQGDYQATPFRDAFEHGGVFLFDEIDASDASALVAFNAAIANKICAFPDAIVKAHKDFKVIAAANTRGKGATREYTGRTPLDAATLDRYAIIDIEYDLDLEKAIATAIFNNHYDASEAERSANFVCEYVQKARNKAQELNLDCVISPRATYDIANAVCNEIDFVRAVEYCLWNKLDATNAELVRSAI